MGKGNIDKLKTTSRDDIIDNGCESYINFRVHNGQILDWNKYTKTLYIGTDYFKLRYDVSMVSVI